MILRPAQLTMTAFPILVTKESVLPVPLLVPLNSVITSHVLQMVNVFLILVTKVHV